MNGNRLLSLVAGLLIVGLSPVAESAQIKLVAVLETLGARDHFSYSVPAALENDTIEQSTPDSEFEVILRGYNYTLVHNPKGAIERVVISGRNDQDVDAPASEEPGVFRGELLTYAPTPAKLPERFNYMQHGAIMAIDLPVDQLNSMNVGDNINLALPNGNYGVTEDNRFEHENGEVSWIGHLSREGKDFQVLITISAEGSVGQITTPTGVYSIDREENQNWLVELQPADQDIGNSASAPAAADDQIAMPGDADWNAPVN